MPPPPPCSQTTSHPRAVRTCRCPRLSCWVMTILVLQLEVTAAAENVAVRGPSSAPGDQTISSTPEIPSGPRTSGSSSPPARWVKTTPNPTAIRAPASRNNGQMAGRSMALEGGGSSRGASVMKDPLEGGEAWAGRGTKKGWPLPFLARSGKRDKPGMRLLKRGRKWRPSLSHPYLPPVSRYVRSRQTIALAIELDICLDVHRWASQKSLRPG